MKRIQYHRYGDAAEMRLEDYELPAPTARQVLVRVQAAALNPFDWKVRGGAMKWVTGRGFPRAMGSDFAGIVEQVGPGVSRFVVGDTVFGSSRLRESGAFAPTVLTDEALLAERPAGLSAEQAACLPIPAITAWRGLFQKTSLQAGQSVYVHGCTGAVGHSAVQLALNAGATVAGSCSAANRQAALDTGVQPVLDYASQKPGDLGRTFDVVFDTAGSLPIANALALTAPRGAVLDINPTPSRLMRGLWSRRYRMVFGQSSVDLLERVAVLAAAGTLHFPIGKRVGLAEAIDVIKDLETGLRLPGRVIISMM